VLPKQALVVMLDDCLARPLTRVVTPAPSYLPEQLVLRSYDNRACFTWRRPDVYLYSGETGETMVVCDLPTAGRQ
jgi:hypothetical protein